MVPGVRRLLRREPTKINAGVLKELGWRGRPGRGFGRRPAAPLFVPDQTKRRCNLLISLELRRPQNQIAKTRDFQR
jgi:hypothetical protein